MQYWISTRVRCEIELKYNLSQWKSEASVILNSFAGGIMESLDNQWILRNNMLNCEENEKTPNTLGLKNMAGVFILVLAGIIGGIVLIVIEVVYKRHQIRKQKRLEIARHAADRWRGAVEVNRAKTSAMDVDHYDNHKEQIESKI